MVNNKWSIRRFIVGIILLMTCATLATAEQDNFKIGDKVEFTNQGETIVGVIEQTLPTGKYLVRFSKGSSRRGQAPFKFLAADQMRQVTGTGDAPRNTAGTASPSSGPQPVRTWKAANGKYEIDASLVSSKGSSVVLKKSDGSTITVDLGKLSQSDRDYVADLNKPKSATSQPSLATAKSNFATAKSSVGSRGTAGIPFANKQLSLKAGKWDYAIDPSEVYDFSLPQKTVSLGAAVGFAADTNSTSVKAWGGSGTGAGTPASGANAPTGRNFGGLGRTGSSEKRSSRQFDYEFDHWVSPQDGERCFLLANSRTDQRCMIQGINFATGRLEFSEELEGIGIGLSPDGSLVALISGDQRDPNQKGTLTIKEVGENGKVLKQFATKQFFSAEGFEPTSGYFLNNSILIVFGKQIVAIDARSDAGYSTSPFPGGGSVQDFVISPNRNVVALICQSEVILFDAAQGKTIGTIKKKTGFGGKVAFSTDSSQLAFCSSEDKTITIYDMSNGELVKTVDCRGLSNMKTCSWPHPRLMLLGNRALFDLELGMVVWEFEHEGSFYDPFFYIGGNTYLSNDGHSLFTSIELPVDRIVATVSDFNVEDATMLAEGEDYRLEIDLPFDESDIAKIRTNIETQMEKNGIKLKSDSNNVVKCYSVDGEPTSFAVKRSQFVPKPTIIKYTPTTSHVELVVDGEVKWEWTQLHSLKGRSRVVLQKRETPQQAANRICAPWPKRFAGVRFPAGLLKLPNGKEIFGESIISQAGVRDK